MNISHQHKIIWWAPEKAGTNAISTIFREIGFEYYLNPNERKFFSKNETYHSHYQYFGEDHRDYKIVCNVRNPYERVYSLFMNFEILPKIPTTKDIKPKLIKYFNDWLGLCFEKRKLTVFINDHGKRNVSSNSLKKFLFREKIPDFFIRCENIVEDVSKLDFVTDTEAWKRGDTQEFLMKNKFKNKPRYDFKEFYTFESAQLVYVHFFNHFHILGYDPFSFTNNELTDEDKIKFLHDTF